MEKNWVDPVSSCSLMIYASRFCLDYAEMGGMLNLGMKIEVAYRCRSGGWVRRCWWVR